MRRWIGTVVLVLFLAILTLCIYGAIKKRNNRLANEDAVDKWAESPGTSGFINLEEVQKAALENKKTEDFEQRVNEIFEGDNLILIDVQGRSAGFILTGVEDLNQNQTPDPGGANGDEVVFQLFVSGSGPNNAMLKGAGVNQDFSARFTYPMPPIDRNYARTYYARHRRYPSFWYYYYYPGYRYYTPRRRYTVLIGYRRTYRLSPRYRTQITRNHSYMGGYRTRYPNSSRTFSRPSSVRSSYVSRTSSSPGFRNNLRSSPNTRARSSMSTGSTTSRSSGFRSGLSSSTRSSSSSGGSRSSSSYGGSRSSFSSSRSSSGFRIF